MDYLYALPGHRWPAARSILEARLLPTLWRVVNGMEAPVGHILLAFQKAEDRQFLHDELDASLTRCQQRDSSAALRSLSGNGLRITIAAPTRAAGWLNYGPEPGPEIDQVGSLEDYAVFGDGTIGAIYCSHVLMRLPHDGTVTRALKEFQRILEPGGQLHVSVPDLRLLFGLFNDPGRDLASKQRLLHYIFGTQTSPREQHRTGFDETSLTAMLRDAGFTDIERVDTFGLFVDSSEHRYLDRPISLNLKAVKPGAA